MKRKIIRINKELCNGCGNCVTACSEGALQIVDGKAILVKEDFCDGFGDCIGECPTGALTIEEREARPFDEGATKDYLLQTQGREAVWRMEEAQEKHGGKAHATMPCGCPGSMAQTFNRTETATTPTYKKIEPQLRNWPVQITLIPLMAPYYENTDLLVAADCCAYAYADFHADLIKNHTLAIGCPKLDNAGGYRDKLATILSENNIRSVTVAYMEVPCCMGLVKLVEEAVRHSGKDIPVRKIKIGIRGEKLADIREGVDSVEEH
ncbi:MAG TPA: 4Fe-4S ferredoxin [Nitrospiraceae bacterium]|nr:4Fe-4S ferredoxin [Nitrospiraceae bacterium]